MLPPPRNDEADVEPEDKSDRNEVSKVATVQSDAFEDDLALFVESEAVEDAEKCVEAHVDDQVSPDQFVD